MSTLTTCCAVCPEQIDLVSITVGGLRLHLCPQHLSAAGGRGHRRFAGWSELLAATGIERRSGADRRRTERRLFPPRPEGRRRSDGRRCTDAQM